VHGLERKLDNIIFGGLKMYVNVPKFKRARSEKSIPEAKRMEHGEQEEQEAPWRRQPYSPLYQGSYAEVVTWNNRNPGSKRTPWKKSQRSEASWSSMCLNIQKTRNKWLNEAWVGRLKNLALFDRVEDDLQWDIGAYVSPKYMGDDMVLLLGLTKAKAQQMMEEEKEGGDTSFYSLEKWNLRLRTGHRMTWVTC